jgi:hypothetical protein
LIFFSAETDIPHNFFQLKEIRKTAASVQLAAPNHGAADSEKIWQKKRKTDPATYFPFNSA